MKSINTSDVEAMDNLAHVRFANSLPGPLEQVPAHFTATPRIRSNATDITMVTDPFRILD